MATVGIDDTLTPGDARKVMGKLLEAMNDAHSLGLALNLQPYEVDAICNGHRSPKDQLYDVIMTSLSRESPTPTWRLFIEALRDPLVGKSGLAGRVEATNFPHSSSNHIAGPKTPGNTAGDDEVISKPPSQLNPKPGQSEPGVIKEDYGQAATGTTFADSPGLAILVACDYEGNDTKETLLGTREDAREMRETFNRLGYLIREMQNPTKEEMKRLLKEISDELRGYNVPKQAEGEKVIVFAFSGHGDTVDRAEKLYANDGGIIDFMDEIVFPLTRHAGVKYVPKLFFIDACRGGEILFTKKGGNKNQVAKSSDEVYFAKGVQHVQGNYCVAYATIPHHVSYASNHGSIWMPKLARALREMNDSFQNVAATVMKEVQDSLKDNAQQCQIVSHLNCGPLMLRRVPTRN